ncbi:hypothetical protein HPHPP1B_0487 [Helicobacter pylori Hp P-1b]|nr:hypothetical protein HPHPP1B_0487 [Helicobacter pylori Hp P-1b]
MIDSIMSVPIMSTFMGVFCPLKPRTHLITKGILSLTKPLILFFNPIKTPN